jgi:hypothetical protein
MTTLQFWAEPALQDETVDPSGGGKGCLLFFEASTAWLCDVTP